MRWRAKNHRAVYARTYWARASARTIFARLLLLATLPLGYATANADEPRTHTVASWYGEDHRGKLMANGKKFNPDRLTAASWFYPLGAKVRVTSANKRLRSVVVTITDRGPAWELVHNGRAIDLSHAAFRQLAAPKEGLVQVKLERLK